MRIAQKRAELARADREGTSTLPSTGLGSTLTSASAADDDSDETGGPRSNAPNDVLPDRPSQFGETLSRAWPGGRDVASSDSDGPALGSGSGSHPSNATPAPTPKSASSGWWPFSGR